MSEFVPRRDCLPAAQQEIWALLAPTVELGFVLYGGTAIALRLGHRTSVDFDFFTEKKLDRRAIGLAFGFLKRSTLIQDRIDTFTVLAPTSYGPVKLSFFGDVSIGRAGTPELTTERTLEVASLIDLMATRLKVILQRVEAKDYVDVAAMIRAGVALDSAMGAASTLYAPAFQPIECLKAMVCFDGGDLANLASPDKELLQRAASTVRSIPLVGLASRRLSAIS